MNVRASRQSTGCHLGPLAHSKSSHGGPERLMTGVARRCHPASGPTRGDHRAVLAREQEKTGGSVSQNALFPLFLCALRRFVFPKCPCTILGW
jgi:hypothetical protein